MACAEALGRRPAMALLCVAAAWLPQIAHAQVPAARATDPAAALMPPPSAATAPPVVAPPVAGRWNVAQLQQSFARADSNADHQLTRAEAQGLAILPRSFEDLDANNDGLLSPQEYQAGVS